MGTKKIFIPEVFAVIAFVGIIIWIITDFYGGMFIYLLMYFYVIVPLLVIYLVSLVDTIISVYKRKISKVKIYSHLGIILSFIILNLIKSDIFKSERLITAHLKDDLNTSTLILRDNGIWETNIIGMFGYSKSYSGKYEMKGDTVIITEKPSDYRMFGDSLLISIEKGAIFKERNSNGNFITQKGWLNHLEIENK